MNFINLNIISLSILISTIVLGNISDTNSIITLFILYIISMIIGYTIIIKHNNTNKINKKMEKEQNENR